jgi:hypothetical protein
MFYRDIFAAPGSAQSAPRGMRSRQARLFWCRFILGTKFHRPHYTAVEMVPREWTMPSGKDFEEYARDCVRLAQQADSPELRDQLLAMAREWMEAFMTEDAAAEATSLE